MSIRLMNIAWECDLSGNDKLVLLALADWANDDGLCWPSMTKLCLKTRATERTVQSSIKRLVEAGHMSREERRGHGCMYLVHPRNNCTPADSAPPQVLPPTPAKIAGNTPKNHQTPLTPLAERERSARRKRVEQPPEEPTCIEVDGECLEALEFRRRALAAMGDGAYRNLIQPCQLMRVSEQLLLRVPSETLRRVLSDRQRDLMPLAVAAGFAGIHTEVLPARNLAPARSQWFQTHSIGGGQP